MKSSPPLMRSITLNSVTVLTCLSVAVIAALMVYWPGLKGPFLLDDMVNLGELNKRGGVVSLENALAFIFENKSGALGRPVSMASFLLSDVHWPSDEFSFKFVNLMFHLINGLLIFYLVFRVNRLVRMSESRAQWLALFVASFWLLHPFNVSTTLYVVQRMTQLSAMFSLLAIIFYIVGRDRLLAAKRFGLVYVFIALAPMTALAVLSKENGILVLAQILLVEGLLYRDQSWKTTKLKILVRWFAVFPMVTLCAYLAYKFPNYISKYEFRDFDLYERLLTQSRILFDYASNIFIPRGFGTGLIHDDFVISKGLLAPATTLLAVVALSIIAVLCWVYRAKQPLLVFGICFFFMGHALESSFIPLELYFEHRNYLPMIGLLLVLVAFFNYVLSLDTKPLWFGVVIVISALYVSSAYAVTKQQVRFWENIFDLLTVWATEHPDSLRAQRIYGQFLGKGKLWAIEGQDVLADAYVKFPNDVSLPVQMLITKCKQDVDSTVSLEDLLPAMDKAYYHGGLITVLKNFSDLYIDGKCATENSIEVAHKVLLKAADVPGMHGGQKADLTFFHAEKYAAAGNLGMAMNRLEVAELHQKDFVVPFRQAEYLASAGLYEDALERIGRARELDQQRKRKWLVPSNDKIISMLETKIVAAQKARDNSRLQ